MNMTIHGLELLLLGIGAASACGILMLIYGILMNESDVH